jgi:hypothetical protein
MSNKCKLGVEVVAFSTPNFIMKTPFNILLSILLFFSIHSIGQKNRSNSDPYFSRKITTKDTITISLLDKYIELNPTAKVIVLRVGSDKDTMIYHLEETTLIETVSFLSPSFYMIHKKRYILMPSFVSYLSQNNKSFNLFLEKKLKKYLNPSRNIINKTEMEIGTLPELPVLKAKRIGEKIFDIKYWKYP